MLEWKEFSAWITLEGEDAVEYDVQISEDEKTVTCWIASEVGKKFSVHLTNKSYKSDAAASYTMDGNNCGTKRILGFGLPLTVTKDGVLSRDGSTSSPFMFSSLSLTDDESALANLTHQNLGVIELTITPAEIFEELLQDQGSFSIPDAKVHESSKKGVTQRITLAEPRNLPIPTTFIGFKFNGPDLVKFSWKYRQIDVLRAKGIAPQLPRQESTEPRGSPTPDSNPLDPSDEADAEQDADAKEAAMLREKLREIEARMASRPDKKPRMKRENNEVIDLTQGEKSRKKFKVEDRGGPSFAPGDVIDLT